MSSRLPLPISFDSKGGFKKVENINESSCAVAVEEIQFVIKISSDLLTHVFLSEFC